MNKKIIWIIVSILLVIIVIGCVSLKIFINSNKSTNLTKIEYRTDIEPLTKRFGKMLSIESCFWKAGTVGKSNFGPSSYWIKGYALISQENANSIKLDYNFSDVDISFENGITPDITGKSTFKWSYNKELSKKLAGAGFVGEFYFDVENNIFYFDLESN